MGAFDELLNLSNYVDDKIYSISTGIVKENWNADFPGKVRVEMFLGENGKNVTGWVPVMSPYAGKAFGYYSLPEVGSEVVIAFNMGDRNCPIVIGTLWNDQNTLPPETAADKNLVKRFKTKGGCEVFFNDEDKKQQVQVTTPGGMGLCMDDDKQTITVYDAKKENTILLDAKNGALELASKKTMSLKVNGKEVVAIDGSAGEIKITTNKVTIDAKQELSLKGQKGSVEGSTTLDVKANSALNLSSSGQAVLKGAMVKIN